MKNSTGAQLKAVFSMWLEALPNLFTPQLFAQGSLLCLWCLFWPPLNSIVQLLWGPYSQPTQCSFQKLGALLGWSYFLKIINQKSSIEFGVLTQSFWGFWGRNSLPFCVVAFPKLIFLRALPCGQKWSISRFHWVAWPSFLSYGSSNFLLSLLMVWTEIANSQTLWWSWPTHMAELISVNFRWAMLLWKTALVTDQYGHPPSC